MKMNKFYYELDENGEFDILHYIGGEDPIYCLGTYQDELEVISLVKELNNSGITYSFECYEDSCQLSVKGLDSLQ